MYEFDVLPTSRNNEKLRQHRPHSERVDINTHVDYVDTKASEATAWIMPNNVGSSSSESRQLPPF
ncbi:hypothetical protein Bhyg_15677, partial [Pseudolycoriella hygida]